MSEFIRQQRMEVLWDSLEGLRAVCEKEQGLSRLGHAAYDAIERLYRRCIRDRFAEVTHEEMRNPVAAAQRIIEKAGVQCAHW